MVGPPLLPELLDDDAPLEDPLLEEPLLEELLLLEPDEELDDEELEDDELLLDEPLEELDVLDELATGGVLVPPPPQAANATAAMAGNSIPGKLKRAASPGDADVIGSLIFHRLSPVPTSILKSCA